MTAPTLTLRHGAEIPVLGLGTWPMDDAGTAGAVAAAVGLGYRHFDTAENYGNEHGVGEGIRRSGIDRAEVFITTKFNKEWHSIDGVRRAFEHSARRLGTDYLDLLLIHWPNPGQDRYVEAFRGLLTLLEEGLVRGVGTSNFKPAHLRRLLDAGLVPDLNQIQLDPFHPRDDVLAVHREHGIATAAWSPLGRGGDLLRHPTVTALAAQYGRTPAQIVLRWQVQQGVVAIPKSARPGRMAENIKIFDFTLTAAQMAEISALARPGHILDADAFGH